MVSNTCRIETIKNTVRRKNNDKDLELKKKPPTRELMLAIVLPAKKATFFGYLEILHPGFGVEETYFGSSS